MIIINSHTILLRHTLEIANALLNHESKFQTDKLGNPRTETYPFKLLKDILFNNIISYLNEWTIPFRLTCHENYDLVSELYIDVNRIYMFILNTTNSLLSRIPSNIELIRKPLTDDGRVLNMIEDNENIRTLIRSLFGKISESRVESVYILFNQKEPTLYSCYYINGENNPIYLDTRQYPEHFHDENL
jgi:hypothetical protein